MIQPIVRLPIPALLLDLVEVAPGGLNVSLPASLGHRRAEPKLLYRPRQQRPGSRVCLLRGGARAENRRWLVDWLEPNRRFAIILKCAIVAAGGIAIAEQLLP